MSEETDSLMNDILALDDSGFPKQKEQVGIFTFLNKVLKTDDTTKVGNVDKEELRVVRIDKDIASYAAVWNLDGISRYMTQEGEDILASSDSKEGFLVKTAVTQRKQLETRGKDKPAQGGGFKLWGRKKEQTPEM
jgi:hypothetical protein